jgi:signal transduction histidine kinase/ActR/RegA family two-component response regulator
MASPRPPGPPGNHHPPAGGPSAPAEAPSGAEALGRLARLAATLLRAPVALAVRTAEGQPPAFAWHGHSGPLGGDVAPVCRHVVEAGKVLAVADVREAVLFADEPAVRGGPLVAWLGAPFLGADGRALGCLCVAAPQPRTWSEEEARLLADLALSAALPAADRSPSEEATLLKDLPHACFVLDLQWRFTYLNPRAERLLAQLTGRPAGGLLGQDVWKECPEVADSTFSRECQQALAEQRPLEAETFYPALHRWFAVRVAPAPDRLCVFLQDVTERTHLERALRQRVDELAAADRGKDEFLIALAHDVRNALVPIRNALHLLRGPAAPEGGATAAPGPDAEQARALAEQEVQRLSRLLEDLLRVSEVGPGRGRLRKERVNLGDLVARCLAAQLPAVTAKGRRLSLHVPATPLWVEADPAHLEQVLQHLLANALKFTAPGGLIEVTAGREDETAVLRVRDDGAGMGPEVLPHVFDLFMRAERGLSRLGGGMGVGLTLVRRLVELNGGTAEAHSDGPGRGSLFTVRLPALADTSPVLPSAAAPPSEAGGPAARRLDVLVVDDSQEAAQSLFLVLNRWGCQVRVAYDGPGALLEARARRPDVVFLDIGMPGMDGYEAAQRLRALEGAERMLLVAVTGYGQDEDRQRAREAGFDYHMVKPVDPEHLQAVLELALSSGGNPPPAG